MDQGMSCSKKVHGIFKITLINRYLSKYCQKAINLFSFAFAFIDLFGFSAVWSSISSVSATIISIAV